MSIILLYVSYKFVQTIVKVSNSGIFFDLRNVKILHCSPLTLPWSVFARVFFYNTGLVLPWTQPWSVLAQARYYFRVRCSDGLCFGKKTLQEEQVPPAVACRQLDSPRSPGKKRSLVSAALCFFLFLYSSAQRSTTPHSTFHTPHLTKLHTIIPHFPGMFNIIKQLHTIN